jgi:hypothetical protein
MSTSYTTAELLNSLVSLTSNDVPTPHTLSFITEHSAHKTSGSNSKPIQALIYINGIATLADYDNDRHFTDRNYIQFVPDTDYERVSDVWKYLENDNDLQDHCMRMLALIEYNILQSKITVEVKIMEDSKKARYKTTSMYYQTFDEIYASQPSFANTLFFKNTITYYTLLLEQAQRRIEVATLSI